MALSDVGAQDAGHHAAEVQQGHAAAPAVVRGRLALHAGEAEEAAAAWRGGHNGWTDLTASLLIVNATPIKNPATTLLTSQRGGGESGGLLAS